MADPLDFSQTTQIDPTKFASTTPTEETSQASVATLEPPTDIPEYEGYSDVVGEGGAGQIDTGIGQVEAQTGEVGEQSTVESRLTGLLSQNSDYMRSARTTGTQMANRRGMLNTSMAAGASQAEAIKAALPIAQQDAGTFAAMEQANLTNEQQAAVLSAEADRINAQFNAGQITAEARDKSLSDLQNQQFVSQQQQEAGMANMAALNESSANFAAEKNKANFAVLSADLQNQLSQIDNQLSQDLLNLEKAWDVQENLATVNGAVYQQLVAAMADIISSDEPEDVVEGKIKTLLHAAGAEYDYVNGTTSTPEIGYSGVMGDMGSDIEGWTPGTTGSGSGIPTTPLPTRSGEMIK